MYTWSEGRRHCGGADDRDATSVQCKVTCAYERVILLRRADISMRLNGNCILVHATHQRSIRSFVIPDSRFLKNGAAALVMNQCLSLSSTVGCRSLLDTSKDPIQEVSKRQSYPARFPWNHQIQRFSSTFPTSADSGRVSSGVAQPCQCLAESLECPRIQEPAEILGMKHSNLP
jgi:hypothetical protein